MKKYMAVKSKFWIGHAVAVIWTTFSIIVSLHWISDLGQLVSLPVAVFIIAGISYLPGYINAFMVVSLLLDRQPSFKVSDPDIPITIIIACHNEKENIGSALEYIKQQDYGGIIKVIVVDNNSSDETAKIAMEFAEKLSLPIQILRESKPGKNHALNKALDYVDTEYVITLDADTILHKSAVRYLVSRIKSAPKGVCAVAGAVLVRNSRQNFIARIQEWDYFLGIASIKRLQGLYQGTLVAQGAFSLYETRVIKALNGWPDAIGEDIVLTWNFLKNNSMVYFEPLAVAFTEVPVTLKHLSRQRSRWARGMIEALKLIKPWKQPIMYVKYMTGINFIMPYLDFIYTFCWIPGLVLAFFGKFWIVGPYTLFVLPLCMIQNGILYNYQKRVFKRLGLKIRKNKLGFVFYVLFYQMLMSPMSILGYIQEILNLSRVWK
ncbi:glycosyltransferase family 2 protein [Lutispora thermophila]|uniref:Biofilm PGA synthesis N-glycosyltransferase PgaC n=1 Tax=Lutispora thermophila DSM 19022 TaxID=1122184 RepID=A0A1M6E6L2_9FIRM|nr:glycosyltransferase [Lutispora thermophila]SHI81136.1 biofilm PGA synthesis N-glycosyltransferase PgaC [Lutispora thermophila DSM 19022]